MARSVSGLRAVITAATLAATVFAAPQAMAEEQPSLRIAKNADAQTRSIAKSAPQVAAAASTACGPGYELSKAMPLPQGIDPKMRHATLFSYRRDSNKGGCSILDNNMGSSRHMKLSVCDSGRLYCDVDEGNFTEYAGPVFTGYPVCATVRAQVWGSGTSSGSPYIDYSTQYAYLCD
ncbi:hypothetical protein [Streptomyces klenkii]|uniref:hypothetical protein n=1 Tax=Streptomyces klenkii TaxID=1420899 RepID=UPI003423FFDA